MSDACAVCGHAWFVPDVYLGPIVDEPDFAYVPATSASTEAEAREHLLIELTDWSWHEDLRAAITGDWRYDGTAEVLLRVSDRRVDRITCHAFAYAPALPEPGPTR